MTAPHGEQIVDDYLGRLEKQLSELHPSQRSELLSQVRGHIVEARSGLVDERDSDLLNILDRLGSPEDISAPMVRPVRRPDWLCIAAALLSCAAGLAGAIGAVMVISVAGSLEEGALSNLVGAVLAIVGGILVFRNAALAAVTLAIAAAGEGYACRSTLARLTPSSPPPDGRSFS